MTQAWGQGVSQEEFMLRDEVICVDQNDVIIGHATKKDSHQFNGETPRGSLHRAFSVFLFDSQGRLMLQQRATDKITFPGVWTNTCCSHQLYGFDPCEVDQPEDIAAGTVPGAKNAAIRKLAHELGISTDSFTHSDFKFLTRLHYWAADVVTHGPESPWGEHEMDYILFAQKDVQYELNPEEVAAVKFVTADELREMMAPDSGLLWSPWFRIIANNFLFPHWWANLNTTIKTEAFVDTKNVYRFDPTTEHMGGAGNAGEFLGMSDLVKNYGPKIMGNTEKKQGAYGKVKVHSHSLFDQLSRVDEVWSGIKYLVNSKTTSGGGHIDQLSAENAQVKFCNDMLGKVSRSFAGVIRQLPQGLAVDIMIFYLVLRALDTVEDDMEAFKGRPEVKIEHLRTFHNTALITDGWSMDGVGLADEKILLQEFHNVVAVFKSLPQASQDVIADITHRMGVGMSEYVDKDLGQGTVTIEDYNLYCHYVAGLVGEGLSRLFYCTGYESEDLEKVSKTLANTMGLFLQKTNIIRDYLEDFVDGRAFWPAEIWKNYSVTGNLGDFAHPENITQAVSCLNHLVTNALLCVPQVLDYMGLIHHEDVFKFCAIPQVMAIATLEELYNNPKVFTGVVKIRKGLAVKLVSETNTMKDLYSVFNDFANRILRKINYSDPNCQQTKEVCLKIIEICREKGGVSETAIVKAVPSVLSAVLAFTTLSLAKKVAVVAGGAIRVNWNALTWGQQQTNSDKATLALFAASVTSLLGYSVLSKK